MSLSHTKSARSWGVTLLFQDGVSLRCPPGLRDPLSPPPLNCRCLPASWSWTGHPPSPAISPQELMKSSQAAPAALSEACDQATLTFLFPKHTPAKRMSLVLPKPTPGDLAQLWSTCSFPCPRFRPRWDSLPAWVSRPPSCHPELLSALLWVPVTS